MAAATFAIGNVLFGLIALILAIMGRRESKQRRSKQLLIVAIGVSASGIVLAVAGWGILGSFLASKAYLEGKYCELPMSQTVNALQLYGYTSLNIIGAPINRINFCYATSWDTLVFSFDFNYPSTSCNYYSTYCYTTTYKVNTNCKFYNKIIVKY